MTAPEVDAVVVGSGPNGLVAAVTLARVGWRVLVLEAADHPGGGCRSAELTLPGFVHDVCSAIHPLALGSPAIRDLALHRHGVRFVHPEVPIGQTVHARHATLLHQSLDRTAAGLGRDGRAWRRLFGPLVRDGQAVVDSVLRPLDVPPRHPIALARFGVPALSSAAGLATRQFRDEDAAALLAGMAAHAMLPLTSRPTAGVGLLFGVLGQTVGFPAIEGGSGRLVDGLVAEIEALGGDVRCGERVTSLADLPRVASRAL